MNAVVSNTLLLGGARSGKSRRALTLAEASGLRKVFIATSEALDDEMTDRIERHKAERGEDWTSIEAPLDVVGAITRYAREETICVIDCLTLWLSNLMHHERDVEVAVQALCERISVSAGPLIFVTNELGLGLVPETPLGRSFRDAQGRLNQAVAEACDRVEFIAAGLPLTLKD